MFLSKGRFGIKIIPLGEIPVNILETMANTVQTVFRKKVFSLCCQEIDSIAIDPKRAQYDAKKLLEYLSMKRNFKEKLLGVINEDIYIQDHPFVFGDADPVLETGIISIWRLSQHQQHFDFDPDLLLQRLNKITVREFARLSGVPYCADPRCVLFNPFTITDLDYKTDTLCQQCKGYMKPS